MQDWLIDELRCPRTGSTLEIEHERKRDGIHLLEGSLRASSDASIRYEVTNGVPNLLASPQDSQTQQTLEIFGNEWQDFHDWGWIDIEPSTPNEKLSIESGRSIDSVESFSLKTGLAAAGEEGGWLGDIIIDCGCGNGRFSREAAKSAGRVIAFDASGAVHAAFANMRKHGIENVGVVRASVLDLPLARDSVDYAFSIGVLQHTGDADRMIAEMNRVVKPGHRLSINCYGTGRFLYELVDRAIRQRTTKLDQRRKLNFARWLARLDRRLIVGSRISRSIEKRLRRVMVLRPTVVQVYDWYAPEIAEHYSPDDLCHLFSQNELEIVAATYPISKPDYDDGPRKRIAGSYCFLLRTAG